MEKTYVCKGDTDCIKADESSNHLTVCSGDADKVTVTYFDRKNKELYDIGENGGTLAVSENSTGDFPSYERAKLDEKSDFL
ncbi:MAG: hypothetical protein K5770_07950 [Lachnospiraceae bacterium]|nr:hypothetical protein [Lachnospiraceae bacterium]